MTPVTIEQIEELPFLAPCACGNEQAQWRTVLKRKYRKQSYLTANPYCFEEILETEIVSCGHCDSLFAPDGESVEVPANA